ncbi:MAG TPA: hypothetical protein VFQ16_14350 [Burkholderiaceae bacterium]|nr:hypothetical protein [Burkholderiaceae bacterium]
MTIDRIDDTALEAALSDPPAALPDAGFTAAVMQRIAADEAARRSPVAPAQALEGLRAIERVERRRARWTRAGLAAGSVLALGVAAIGADGAALLTGETALALAAAFAVTAWQLAEALGRPSAPHRAPRRALR